MGNVSKPRESGKVSPRIMRLVCRAELNGTQMGAIRGAWANFTPRWMLELACGHRVEEDVQRRGDTIALPSTKRRCGECERFEADLSSGACRIECTPERAS